MPEVRKYTKKTRHGKKTDVWTKDGKLGEIEESIEEKKTIFGNKKYTRVKRYYSDRGVPLGEVREHNDGRVVIDYKDKDSLRKMRTMSVGDDYYDPDRVSYEEDGRSWSRRREEWIAEMRTRYGHSGDDDVSVLGPALFMVFLACSVIAGIIGVFAGYGDLEDLKSYAGLTDYLFKLWMTMSSVMVMAVVLTIGLIPMLIISPLVGHADQLGGFIMTVIVADLVTVVWLFVAFVVFSVPGMVWRLIKNGV